MDNNFKFKTRHVSIVQRSSSVVNSFASSVELIQAMTYKLKRDTVQNFEKLTCNFKMRETWNNTCASTTLNTRKRAWNRAPYSFGCHVIDRAYASTDCTGGVGETIKRKGGVSQACLCKSTSFTLDIHSMVN